MSLFLQVNPHITFYFAKIILIPYIWPNMYFIVYLWCKCSLYFKICYQWTLGQITTVQTNQIDELFFFFFNITSLGFSDIGFSPCASRTWSGMKDEKHVKSPGSSESKQCFHLHPETFHSCKQETRFPTIVVALLFYNSRKVILSLRIWHQPTRSWETTFFPLPWVRGPGERGVPGHH